MDEQSTTNVQIINEYFSDNIKVVLDNLLNEIDNKITFTKTNINNSNLCYINTLYETNNDLQKDGIKQIIINKKENSLSILRKEKDYIVAENIKVSKNKINDTNEFKAMFTYYRNFKDLDFLEEDLNQEYTTPLYIGEVAAIFNGKDKKKIIESNIPDDIPHSIAFLNIEMEDLKQIYKIYRNYFNQLEITKIISNSIDPQKRLKKCI